MASQGINLIKHQTDQIDFLMPVEAKVRSLALLIFICVIAVSIGTLLTFVIVSSRLQILSITKTSLTRKLQQQKAKESLLLTIKNRIKIVEKAMEKGRQLSQVIDQAFSVDTYPRLTSISENEKEMITLVLHPLTLEEANTEAQRVIDLFNENRVESTQIDTLSLDTGGIRFNMTYKPIWPETN